MDSSAGPAVREPAVAAQSGHGAESPALATGCGPCKAGRYGNCVAWVHRPQTARWREASTGAVPGHRLPGAFGGADTPGGGEALGAEHGGPARLLVPHLYLWKSAKWVTGIDLLTEDEPGFWETLGYHNYGDPWQEQRYWGD